MNSYDDLQRFKEKTQTNHIEFKDMSEQVLSADTTNWALIKQLLNDGAGSVLDKSQRIDRAAPQPADPAAFTPPPAVAEPASSTLRVQSFVATTPASSDRVGASLLDSISASLPTDAAAVSVAQPAPVQAGSPADVAPLRALPVARQTALSGSTLLAQLAARSAPESPPAAVSASPVPQAPTAAPVEAPAPPASVSYKQLFSTGTTPSSASLPKDMLLHPLLEKIASCR
ncbi:cellulose biosynthesis protein BcsO [Erwinia persicina]|uniref:cellulose biosynthesis protein BcsO n=1 Tax=Erwinia persicina TaxID=55211 RepID=UPI00177DAB29|nr:cellulose biosynthesis protein BcsO [Erwinia persicina]MBD8163968.1 cellulose biosynthesis protein BcsO [Erwinia persicina]